jgi:hypothetical protein
MNVQECLVVYGQAWFESDHERRVEVLRRCCTEDIVFMDPQLGRLEGLDAVSKMIGGYYDAARGDSADDGAQGSEASTSGRSDANVSVEVVTPIDVQHGFFRYSFVWRFADGTESGGTDFCELADDGRMKLITVWSANDNFPLPLKRP